MLCVIHGTENGAVICPKAFFSAIALAARVIYRL